MFIFRVPCRRIYSFLPPQEFWNPRWCQGTVAMKSVSLMMFAFVLSFTFITALKCKCTQSSNRNPCDGGICEVDANGSCLTLNHESSGYHYACSTSKLTNGLCTDKNTKSGQKVTVCSCNSGDFCNYREGVHQLAEDEDANSSHSVILSTSLMLISMAMLRWT